MVMAFSQRPPEGPNILCPLSWGPYDEGLNPLPLLCGRLSQAAQLDGCVEGVHPVLGHADANSLGGASHNASQPFEVPPPGGGGAPGTWDERSGTVLRLSA